MNTIQQRLNIIRIEPVLHRQQPEPYNDGLQASVVHSRSEVDHEAVCIVLGMSSTSPEHANNRKYIIKKFITKTIDRIGIVSLY
jgi:hypothetical protein